MPNTTKPTKYCLGCSYVLDGLPTDRCPECGRKFDLLNPKTYGCSAQRTIWRRQLKRIGILSAILVPLELLAGMLAYETIGEVDSFFILFLTAIGNAAVGLFVLLRLPRLALAGLLIIAVLLIPNQLVLGVKYCLLSSEAERIVAYIELSKVKTGEYPPDLSGYTFRYPSLQHHFNRYDRDDSKGGYILFWYVGTRTTSHWYSPNGGWDYYPD